MKYTIVVPAYNEGTRIQKLLKNIVSEFERHEIIVVDDGSQDKTAEIAKSYGVKVIKHKGNMGKGAAIKTGFLNSKGDITGFIDADESISPEDIERVFCSAENKTLAIASRYHPNSNITIKQPLSRRIASRSFNSLVQILFCLNVTDTLCGCKAMKTNIAKEIAMETQSNGFEWDVELLWLALIKGYRIKEVPVTWKHEKDSTFWINLPQFCLTTAPKMLVSLLKIRIQDISKKPLGGAIVAIFFLTSALLPIGVYILIRKFLEK